MNIHEYQAKEVLRGFGVPVPNGKAAFTVFQLPIISDNISVLAVTNEQW